MVNEEIATGSTTMIATLKFLSRITDQVFESQMQRAAQRIANGNSISSAARLNAGHHRV